jgi:hypothetical protein
MSRTNVSKTPSENGVPKCSHRFPASYLPKPHITNFLLLNYLDPLYPPDCRRQSKLEWLYIGFLQAYPVKLWQKFKRRA